MATTSSVFNPILVINNIAVNYVPNSIKYVGGQGEYNMRVQTAGAGKVQSVFSRNMETALGDVKFTMISTSANIALKDTWKSLLNTNAITITDIDSQGNIFTKPFNNSAMMNDPDIGLGPDGTFELVFKGDASDVA